MSNITNPQAVAFCNNEIRVMADSMTQNYYTAKSIVNDWFSTGVNSLIPNDSSLIIDGSAIDGRSPITGSQVTNIITRAQEIVADYEANSSAKFNTINAVKVNGGSRF